MAGGQPPGRFVGLVLSVALGLAVATAAVGADTSGAGASLADVDGVAITNEELEAAIGAPLYRLEEQMYALKRQKLEALIVERILAREAAKRGMSVQALLQAESANVEPVTEEEVDAAFDAQKDRAKGDPALLRAQIRSQLQGQKAAAHQRAFLDSLRGGAQVSVHLEAPPIRRTPLNLAGAPSKGPDSAPVTIVEFQDFHCPFCERVQPVLAALEARYGDRIRLVYRDFPIDQLHPQARKAHEAARCALAQGKFWAFHDVLYARSKTSDQEALRGYAEEVGLNLRAFDRCVGRRTYQAAVQNDIEEGVRAGVTGTPTFFINGRLISGAQPLERFALVIDEELKRTQ
jgi:protein-disulfide isomerase